MIFLSVTVMHNFFKDFFFFFKEKKKYWQIKGGFSNIVALFCLAGLLHLFPFCTQPPKCIFPFLLTLLSLRSDAFPRRPPGVLHTSWSGYDCPVLLLLFFKYLHTQSGLFLSTGNFCHRQALSSPFLFAVILSCPHSLQRFPAGAQEVSLLEFDAYFYTYI